MKIAVVLVTSLDGKITRESEGPSHWASPEDQSHYFSLIKESALVVMGRRTYESAKSFIQRRLTPQTLRIVLTTSPEQFQSDQVSGQIEFSNESAEQLVTRLEHKGYTEMVVVGGSHVNSLFLNAGLVTDIWMTVEPYIFGAGINMLAQSLTAKAQMKLENVKKLNEQGTLLLHYSVRFESNEIA